MVIISMMVLRNANVFTEYDRIRLELPNALLDMGYDNNIEQSRLSYQFSDKTRQSRAYVPHRSQKVFLHLPCRLSVISNNRSTKQVMSYMPYTIHSSSAGMTYI